MAANWLAPAGHAILIAAYLTLNSALCLANKRAFSWFPFPLLLSAAHMAFGFVMLLPLMLQPHKLAKVTNTLRGQWRGLATIGSLLALNISLNNTALVGMTLSLNQVIRASSPVFTSILSTVVEGHRPGEGEIASLLTITAGVMTALWQNTVAGAPRAIVLCLASTICHAATMTFSGRLLSERLDVLELNFLTAPVSLLTIVPFLFLQEMPTLRKAISGSTTDSITVIAGTSAVALAYNIVHSILIQQTSAVTTTVIGQVKVVGLLLLSAFLLGEKDLFTVKMTIGAAIAVIGFVAFSLCKLDSRQRKASSHAPGDEETLKIKLISDPAQE